MRCLAFRKRLLYRNEKGEYDYLACRDVDKEIICLVERFADFIDIIDVD